MDSEAKPVNEGVSLPAGEIHTGTTRGIAPAQTGALAVLQHAPLYDMGSDVQAAARELATYHSPEGDQFHRLAGMADALTDFLEEIVRLTPPGPERSTAISRAREAKFWASAAIALEGH